MPSSGGGISSYLGSKWAAVVVVAAAATGALVIPSVTGGGAQSANLWVSVSPGTGCARSGTASAYDSATDCTLAAAITAASNGDTIRLKGGAYGVWTGTSKSVTIKPATGEESTITPQIGSGDTGFTIDGEFPGMDIVMTGGPSVDNGATNVTYRNVEFRNTTLAFNQVGSSNILLDHNWFHGSTSPCLICVFGGTGVPTNTGVTVQDSLLEDTGADGITAGQGITIRNNLFRHIESVDPESHTDAIQGNGADQLVITGNVIRDCTGGAGILIGTFGSVDNVVEHNAFTQCNNPMQVNQVAGLSIKHNTIDPGANGGDALWAFNDSTVTVQNNVAGSLDTGGSTSVTASKNMLTSGGSSPNFTGTPTYVGSALATYSDFCLTAASAGYTGATDGTQVGVCGGDYTGSNYGPPSEWYTWAG